MLCRFGHVYEGELDDAQEELSTQVLQVVDSPCVDMSPLEKGIHAKSALVCTPMDEQVVGHLSPIISDDNKVDLELDDLPHGVLKDFEQVGKRDKE